MTKIAALCMLTACAWTATAQTTATTTTASTTSTTASTTASTARQFGSYASPFAADSLWNARPINPVLDTYVIPTSLYYPAIESGAFSTGLFLASATDAPMTITGLTNPGGMSDPDIAGLRTVTLPHWPAKTVPATGSDGHADIFDPTTNIIHSFWQLKQTNGKWQAALYAWSPADGKGWGDPAHFYHGARATGVPAAAGLIRSAEVIDGLPTYRHALAMSMTYNGLSAKTPYIFPATSADGDAASTNSGQIPEGALMMLPASYDTSKIASLQLRKIADTLKLYGAYVVDRNYGTPFTIFAETGSSLDLHHGGWDNAVAAELQRIRANLRQVKSAGSWVDGNGQAFVPATQPTATGNALSMRGPWSRTGGTTTGVFDSWTQTVQFPASTTRTVMYNSNSTGLSPVNWGSPKAGTTQRLTIISTGGATLHAYVMNGAGKVAFDAGNLANKDSVRFVWPAGGWLQIYAASGTSNVPSTVRADLVTITP